MTNLANFDLLGPGSLAFKSLLNANWTLLDSACVTERSYPSVSTTVSVGDLIAYDSSGDPVRAYDNASADLTSKMPIGYAMNAVTVSGPLTVRLLGVIASTTISGSPSIGDSLYLSGTAAGKLSTTPGPNAIACAIFAGGSSALFRPRLKVVS